MRINTERVGHPPVQTNPAGAPEKTCENLPYGNGPSCTASNVAPTNFDYAGLQYDPESGLDHATARQYASTTGRWLSPDPYDGSMDIGNPQTLNRYNYAGNSPLNFIDPSGLFPIPCTPITAGALCMGVGGFPGGPLAAVGEVLGGVLGPLAAFAEFAEFSYASDHPVLHDSLKPRPKAPSNGSKKCSGTARVLQGNAATIGKPGGFSGSSVGNFPVTANGAAIIPSQFGMSKAALRPFIGQISGVFPNVGVSFQGLVDTVGSTTIPNIQSFLMNKYPGQFIAELPGATQDYGSTAVTLTVPSGVGCPTGTVQVP